MQAHEELVRSRPGGNASLAVWLAYYQRSVQLYEQIVEVDPGHGLEALYWARRERHRAEEIAARIRAATHVTTMRDALSGGTKDREISNEEQ